MSKLTIQKLSENDIININIKKLNNVSNKLIQDASNVYYKLEQDDKITIDKIVNNIMKKLEKDNYLMKPIKITYMLVSENTINMKKYNIPTIDTSSEIKSKMNKLNIYNLHIYNHIVVVKIYYRYDFSYDTNLKKIMTRLYNLIILLSNKNNNLYDFTYIFYLYNNVRRADMNKSGEKYLNCLHNSSMRIFNTSSGLTNMKDKVVLVSRTEDCLGLLTHEMLHACNDYNFESNLICHGLEINLTEAYVNMYASILNAYLTCSENDDNINIKQYIILELIHSIIHFNKLAIISGYNIFSLLDPTCDINFYQDAYMYEYIIGKMLLFLNFSKNINQKKYLSLYGKYNVLINHIIIIYNNLQDNLQDTIMQYHCIDSMMIIDNKLMNGGSDYYIKYIKYKKKYIKLQKKIKL